MKWVGRCRANAAQGNRSEIIDGAAAIIKPAAVFGTMRSDVGRDRLISPFHRTRRGTATPPYSAATAIVSPSEAEYGVSSDLSAIGSATAEGLAKEDDPALQ